MAKAFYIGKEQILNYFKKTVKKKITNLNKQGVKKKN